MDEEITLGLEIEFRRLECCEVLDGKIRGNVAKLNRYYDHIISFRVVSQPSQDRHN